MSSKNAETRTRILDAALKVLEREGGRGVRMSDIAAAAGVSRQAVYLHFESRVNLMVATVQYGDEVNRSQTQIIPWTQAEGVAKLDAWIEFWGGYVPQIYGVAKALMLDRDADVAAAAAWQDRMANIRASCRETIDSLAKSGQLTHQWNSKTATDFLWTMLSISAWEDYTQTCGWSDRQYVQKMKKAARLLLTEE